MSNLKYLKGRRGEYKCQRILEKEGYFTIRSAGSKTDFDVVATLRPQHAGRGKSVDRWIQVKSYKATKKDFDKIEAVDYLGSHIPKELWVLEPYKELKIYYF